MASSTAEPAVAPAPDTPPSNAPPPDKDDVDTCRICRGESTPDEPLFYPCKCSGSIKYVHQECLMEWLSHSQKKYCELCKTSFRFTKLYHPGMPSTIPTSVFLRRAAVHILKLFMTWCRAVLVASVWLILLPWCMRVVWRSLFWVGDGGWHRDDYIELRAAGNASSISSTYDLDALHAAVKAARPENRTSEIPIPNLLMPFSHAQNSTSGNSRFFDIAKRFLFGFAAPRHSLHPLAVNKTETNVTTDYLGQRNPSLLSDVSFFNWFPSQAANRFLVDVLEGQIITLAVVVAFILIFLIREWVVQQQPVINMVALGEDAAAAAADQAPGPGEDEEHDEADFANMPDPRPAEDMGTEESGEDPVPDAPWVERVERSFKEGRTIMEKWRESGRAPVELIVDAFIQHEFDLTQEWDWFTDELPEHLLDGLSNEMQRRMESQEMRDRIEEIIHRGRPLPERSSSLANNPVTAHEPYTEQRTSSASPSRRPHMPARGQSSIAAEIQRRIQEDNSWSFDDVPESTDAITRASTSVPVPDSWEDDLADAIPPEQEQSSSHSSESWQQVPDIIAEGSDPNAPKNKGKGKAADVGSRNDSGESTDGSHDAGSVRGVGSPEAGDASSNASSDSFRDGARSNTGNSQTDAAPLPPPEEEYEAGTDREAEPEHAGNVQPPQRLLDRILDWMFDGVAPGAQAAEDGANDEIIIRNPAAEAPFVPFAANEPREFENLPIQDPEVAAAAAQAGIDVNDQDAIDDAEDLEGIMELIGMQGPLTGLFQNATFSAVLISATLACAVWVPYLWGKLVLLFMGSPVTLFIKLPLQIVATFADLLVDSILFVVAGAVYGTTDILSRSVHLVSQGTAHRPFMLVSEQAFIVLANAANRLGKLVNESPLLPLPTYFSLSISAHEALRTIQNTTSHTLNETSNLVTNFLEDAAGNSSSDFIFSSLGLIRDAVTAFFMAVYYKSSAFVSWLSTTRSYNITFDLGSDLNPPASAVEPWTASDRFIAVLAGYAFVALIGAIYLRRGSPLSGSQQGQKIERTIAEILQQAGGVLKVILIISIEMLVFPLYCGLLLDMALLPLFKDANLYTRWQFTLHSPWTSGFVHWFIGTCYMFHFALFVSMCRKIMRRGVLYFIRDPDDPQFHPVRDVLERSVTTQLRKIAFSALVYGALVIVCLGGVVWSLNRLTTDVLPIHWASHAPSLELPLDLLFYNFLTPVIIKLYKPSDTLQIISGWWFRLCARFLRLSNFLFGEEAKDQEGRKVNGETVFEGRYVRAPASDQVRIPKGDPVFIEVDAKNVRKDGLHTAGGVHNTPLVTKVYIPPYFRLRIAIFVLTIWLFAAVAGVSATIIPLLFGRYIFSLVLPPNVEMNDIHSFSLGLYTVGSLAYTSYHTYTFLHSIDRPFANALATLYSILHTTSHLTLRILRFAYVWTALVLLIPFLFAVLIEFYGLIPLHAYLGPGDPHVVHLVQDWTLGFLYARLVARLAFQDRASRPARAFAAVVRRGYADPDVRVTTRCFVLPVLALFGVAMAVPSLLAGALTATGVAAGEEARRRVWRFAFPGVGVLVAGVWAGREGWRAVGRWRGVVRDEVYLVGERLHNFGERRRGGVVGAVGGEVR